MEFEYKFLTNEYGEREYCDTCACEAMVCEFDNPDIRKRDINEKVFLCEICAATHVGSEIRLKNEILSPTAFAQAMNIILNKLNILTKNG